MSVDSRDKRASAASLPFMVIYPEPDGSIILGDRLMVAGVYALPPWRVPDSHEASCEDDWDNCANAYDGNVATFAEEKVANMGRALDLIFSPPIRSEKFRFLGHDVDEGSSTSSCSAVSVYVYYDDAWHKHGPYTPNEDEWYEISVGEHLISKIRVIDEDLTDYLYVGEVQMLDLGTVYPSAPRPKVDGNLTRNPLICGGLIR